MSDRAKTLTKRSIVFMVFATVFAFRNIVNNQVQFGLVAIGLFLLGGIIYALPLVFITSEFASIKKLKSAESGLGSWCVFSLGKKWGYLASWAAFFSNLFFFATIAPLAIIAFSFCVYGGNGFDDLAKQLADNGMSGNNASRVSATVLALSAVIVFWIGTYVSKKGPKVIGKVVNIAGMASLLLGVLFIVSVFLITLPMNHGKLSPTFDTTHLNPMGKWSFNGDWWGFMSAFPWVIMSYSGLETIGVFIKDTKGGASAFQKASLIGMVITSMLMVLGSLALSMSVDQDKINGEWGLTNSFYLVFPAIFNLDPNSVGGQIIVRVVGFITCVNTLGALLVWTVGPVKVFFSEVPEGVMGKWVAKTDKNAIPTNALTMQAIIVTIILLLVGVTTVGTPGQGSSEFLTRITQTTTALSVLPMLFLFAGYIRLRWKMDDTERDLRFFKTKRPAIIIASISIGLLIIGFFFGVIPSPMSWQNDVGNAGISFALSTGGFIVFMGFAYLMWYLNIERKQKKVQLVMNEQKEQEKVKRD